MSLKGELLMELAGHVAGHVLNAADNGLDKFPKAKENIKSGFSKIGEKLDNIDESKVEEKLDRFEKKLDGIEKKCETIEERYINYDEDKGIVDEIQSLPHNYLSNILGNKDISKLLNENPQNKKMIAYGFKGGTAKSVLILETWYMKGIVFEFYNESGEGIYVAKGRESLTAKCYHIGIFDSNGREISSVDEELLAIRAPIIHENNPHNYKLRKNGKVIGEVRTAFKGIKLDKQYNIKIQGQKWSATRNIVNSRFCVFDENKKQMLSINGVNALHLRNIYVLDIAPEVEDELAIQLFSTLLASSYSTKIGQ